ncbi:MAG: response regulator transcription factor [Lachnospiraceae bacterium]|nr:response regulator transcription factor [Lachnospiraceae bacterium]MBQ8547593.1 response regulator transcription factor [Lachnospiraceae bacterium]MBQ8847262.1 response regulator transcription factor [Lachnospiraceae bacterium]
MKVLVVDDDRVVGISLKTILEAEPDITVPALGRDGAEAIALYKEHQPDILLMDIRMEGVNGLDAAATILATNPTARILFLTTFSDDEYIIRALRLGAKGYLLKQDFESIVPALHAVYGGQNVFGSEVVKKIPDILSAPKEPDVSGLPLNEKEIEIMKLVAEGLNNKEIAQTLFLSEGTVRNYLSSTLEKLDLRDRTQLAIYYYKHVQS